MMRLRLSLNCKRMFQYSRPLLFKQIQLKMLLSTMIFLNLSNHSIDDISGLVELPHFIPIPRQRFFREIFSGPNSPLTKAILNSGIPCIEPFDILIKDDFDILNDTCYEMMLRIVAARLVGSLHGAPPCTEYSLLKLKSPGPPPCRSPQSWIHLFLMTPDAIRDFL